jgi:mitochondrial import receptor subunit TOM22
MIPATKRQRLVSTFNTVSGYVRSSLWWGAKASWVVSTSLLLVAVPYALAMAEESQILAVEREQEARQMGNEVSALAGGGPLSPPTPGKAGLMGV